MMHILFGISVLLTSLYKQPQEQQQQQQQRNGNTNTVTHKKRKEGQLIVIA